MENFIYSRRIDCTMVESILSGKKWRNTFSFVLVVVSFAGIMCTGCINQEEDTETQGSEGFYLEDYFRGDFVVTGEPFLNNEVEIVFSVNPPVDSLDTEIQIFLPEEIELVQGDLHWKGDILRDEVVEIRTTVKPVQEGQWEIHVYVKGMLDGKYEKDRTYYLVFLTSKDSGQVSRTSFYYEPANGKIMKEMIVGLILRPVPTPNVGEDVVMNFVVLASKDMTDVKVTIVLPEEFILVAGTLEWAGDLKKEKEEIFQITVKPTEIGMFEVLGILMYNDKEFKFAYRIFVH